jgi:hypothetical protein
MVAMVSILRWAVAIGEGFFRIGIHLGSPPLSLLDMLFTIGGGSKA